MLIQSIKNQVLSSIIKHYQVSSNVMKRPKHCFAAILDKAFAPLPKHPKFALIKSLKYCFAAILYKETSKRLL